VRITADEAREYFAHPSQKTGIDPDNLPGDPVQYWAEGGVCGLFHPSFWPDVWMGHYAVKPEVWGKTIEPARAILLEFWEAASPQLIIGWTDQNNRQALKFARRLGFKEIGTMRNGVVTQEWTPWV
jgi:RimJ/RimL family protein N-acetyltransferase